MPRTKREWIQRKLDQASGNLDWAMQHLKDVHDDYEAGEREFPGSDYTPYKESCIALSGALVEIQKALLGFKAEV